MAFKLYEFLFKPHKQLNSYYHKVTAKYVSAFKSIYYCDTCSYCDINLCNIPMTNSFSIQ